MRVDNVASALVLAGRGDGEVLDGEHGGELVEVLGVPDADPPRRSGAARPRATMSPPALMQKFSAPAAASRSAATATAQPLTRPDGSRRPAGRAEKYAARRALERQAAGEHLVDLRAALGQRQLAAVEAADVAVVAVGAEGRVDLAQPVERRLEVDAVGSRTSIPIGMPMMWRTWVMSAEGPRRSLGVCCERPGTGAAQRSLSFRGGDSSRRRGSRMTDDDACRGAP